MSAANGGSFLTFIATEDFYRPTDASESKLLLVLLAFGVFETCS